MRLAILLSLLASSIYAQDLRLQETWETGYRQQDSTGAHVLGHWKFDGDNPLKDNSGKSNDLTLHGAKPTDKGKFEGGLESFPGFPVEDKPHGAHTGPKPKLSPRGHFTLEMWIAAKPDFAPAQRCFLLDKKYVDHTDYQWQLLDADKSGQRRMSVNLGFGSESKSWVSQPVKLDAGAWHHVAFTYDGAGEGRFFFDGASAGQRRHEGYSSITPGAKPLCIGDRLGSNYGGFPGYIDEVRICEGALNFEQVAIRIGATRHVWRRLEPTQPIEVTLTNLKRAPLSGAKLRLSLGDANQDVEAPELKSGQSFTAKLTLNSALKPDHYPLRARLELKDYATEQADDFQIVARPVPHTMPVVMWGASPDDTARLKEIGFTHCLGLHVDAAAVWEAKQPTAPGKPEVIQKNRQMLDRALADGIGVVASLSPSSMLERDDKLLRVDRSGKPYARRDIDASLPEFATFYRNLGRSVAQTYGDMPAFAAALIDTEVRDNNALSFGAVDVENYRKFAGVDIPQEAATKQGVDYTKLKNFPSNRVIADDDPLLKYYRWFWTVGDGWNALHSALSDGVKENNDRVWTWFDPAVRQPSISGAGGTVDVLSHWTYTYPDPQRIGLAADQLFALSAASGRNQQVMKMTQLIWYRSQTAPTGAAAPGGVVAWEDHDPDAAYITIAPMHLREAFWTKLARPIQGIMYHGWQSLVQTDSAGSYRFTNPNTAYVLKQLIHDVVQPLGPTLLQIPDQRSEVAILESFTSQMFARRGGYGSNLGWSADVWLALQHAHVQCDVLFEEALLAGGLEGRKVMVMPECDVLTKTLVEKIAQWQKQGGKIVADEFLCPALKADAVLPSFKRVKKADVDKAKVLELAKTIAGLSLPAMAECDNPEIIVRTRKFGDATYVFVVNDLREFGNYVGQHGLVMENGLPSRGIVTLSANPASVYDLTRGTLLDSHAASGKAIWSVELGPCDGRIFMVVPQAIAQLKVDLPEQVKGGGAATVSIKILDAKAAAVRAVSPVRLDIRDANGKPAEGAGFYGAKNGTLTVELNIAPNDDPGVWQIDVRDLASGIETTKFLRVVKP